MSRLLRENLPFCFLLLWLALLYSWQVSLFIHIPARLLYLPLFTLFVIVHIGSYWLGLSRSGQRFWSMLSLGGLMLSVLGMILFSRSTEVIGGLALALLVEVTSMLGRTRLAVCAGVACLVLFFLSTRLATGTAGFGFIPSLLFLGGYTVLYAQQAYAHKQTQILLRTLEGTHAELETTHAQLAAYAVHMEELTLAAERQRLARELHDTQAQGLTGLILQLEAVNSHLSCQRYERAQQIVVQATGRARTTLAEARRVIDDLRAEGTSPSDLPEAVQEEIHRFTSTTGIACDTDLAALVTMPVSLCDYVLRAISEALTNIARHAQADSVWIYTGVSESILSIEVRDNGIGFDPSMVTRLVGHYGLLGMRERARLAGGHCDILSAAGTGTMIRLYIPLKSGGNVT